MGEREVIARVCRDLPELPGELEGQARTEFDRLLPELRSGTVSIGEFCRAIGYPTVGEIRDADTFHPIPGLGKPKLPPGSYRCPKSLCGRVEPRLASGAQPWCDLFELALWRLPDEARP